MKVYEETLPVDIQERIKDIKKEHLRKKNNPQINDKLEHLWCELYGSINASQHSFEISKETADYLREKYLFNFEESRDFDD